ncbi:MAG: methyltransferase domain-containing protein [Pseudomonadota bacterium]
MNDSPYRDFQFPLNIYAYLLHLELGKVAYLHYALFDHAEESVGRAQQRSTDLILERLPPAPAALLEVGIGTGTTLGILVRAGYRVTGISPDAAQVELARQGLADISPPPEFKLESVGFENYSGSPGAFDLILLQESFQYVNSQQLFTRAHELLVAHGRVLILDEFIGPSHTDYAIHLPQLSSTLALAEECGFVIEEQLDLSKQAAPTVDYLLEKIAHHREALLTELSVSEEQLHGLNAALQQYKAAYADGSCRYVLLQLRRR